MRRRLISGSLACGFLATWSFSAAPADADGPQLLRTVFEPEPIDLPAGEEVPPPTFLGKQAIAVEGGQPAPRPTPPLGDAPEGGPAPVNDAFLADGAETGLAVDIGNPNVLVGALNQGFTTTPSMKTSSNGNLTWITRTFPNGSGTYVGPPFDPWAEAGNTPGQLFTLLIRRNTATFNSHCVIARSSDAGITWPLFFERLLDVFQDRAMLDIDRPEALGGGAGGTHDGKVYLCYDNWGPNFSGYVGSYLQVVSPGGAALNEVVISTAAVFRGSQVQPVAGIADGQVYLMGLTTSSGGANRVLRFHEMLNSGSNVIFNKSTLSFPTGGQPLGASGYYGLNGHRINAQMFLDIDRTAGPRHGYVYVISNRNPNQSNTALDQGDIHLSVSSNGALTWSTALIPGQTSGKTQFFPMLDIDEQGWVHVAYYQNESGSVNGGVLNASAANLYYTRSTDGGSTWTPPVQLNSGLNTLDYFDPPLNLAGQSYYLIGDYCQLRALRTCSESRVYVLWTTYDKDRSDFFVNDKRERVICTKLMDSAEPLEITQQPVALTACLDGIATFSVVATGLEPISYQWQRNGVDIDGATQATYTIDPVAPDSGDSYFVVVSNACTVLTSNAAVLTVDMEHFAPSIVMQPADQTACLGGPVTFTVTAEGDPPLSYQWTRNGNPIAGATDASYTIAAAQFADVGQYAVVVSNNCGSRTSSPVTLSVQICMITIVSANPPHASGNPYLPGQPFRDVLDTGTGATLTAGIGAAGTTPQGGVSYSPISVTFSAPLMLTPQSISVSCTGGACPSVTSITGSGPGPYQITLSSAIPPLHCTTMTFAGTAAGQKLRYQSAPGDLDLDGAASTIDLLWLVQRLNDGSANQAGNLARSNVDRSPGATPVNTQDLLRLVQLLNGTNATQAFNGATVAVCPP